MTNKDLSIFSNEKVLQFYKELPFNYYSSVEEQSKNILLGEQNFKIYGPLVNELKTLIRPIAKRASAEKLF